MHMYIYMYVYVYIYMYIYIYMYECMHTYICTCLYSLENIETSTFLIFFPDKDRPAWQ